MSNPVLDSPQPQWIDVAPDQQDGRIDNFLITRLKGVPRSLIYRILRSGEVRVNKGRVRPHYRLQAGDRIRIPPLRLPAPDAAPPVWSSAARNLEQAVLYEDERILVVNKPAGLAVHGGSGVSLGVIEALRQLRPDERGLELVHRLDRETSGCLLLAKKRSALRLLHELIRDQALDKRYLALLVGRLPRPSIEVNQPLLKNILQGGERVVKVSAQGKPALSHFKLLWSWPEFSLVEVRIATGRTHQIRVHSAFLGTPVAGDDRYGDADANRRLKQMGLSQMFLHAHTLSFRLADEASHRAYQAPLPEALSRFLAILA